MNSLRVVFRVDASIGLGSGHVMRCLTLADEIKAGGGECLFICLAQEGSFLGYIRQRGFLAHGIEAYSSNMSIMDQDSSDSINDWVKDAEQTKDCIGEAIVDWLIVDHYGLDARWEQLMRPICRYLMVIDDIANRPHFCDVLIDQNYEHEERYKLLVPLSCQLLLGPRFALLRPEFIKYRNFLNQRAKSIKKVFIFFGGSDPHDLTKMALQALSVPELNHLEINIVVGQNYAYYESLHQLAIYRGKTQVHGPRNHLADLMASSDIAIGAGGVTNWERICLGLPSIVITLAENQIPICEILHRQGFIRLLGKSEDVTLNEIKNAMLDEVQCYRLFDSISSSMEICDGHGVSRVLKVMTSYHTVNDLNPNSI